MFSGSHYFMLKKLYAQYIVFQKNIRKIILKSFYAMYCTYTLSAIFFKC